MKREYIIPTIKVQDIQIDDLLVIHYSRLTGHADPQVKHFEDTPQQNDKSRNNDSKWGDLW